MGGDHKCPVCGSTFTRSQHVARHMRSRTSLSPFPPPSSLMYFSSLSGDAILFSYNTTLHSLVHPTNALLPGMTDADGDATHSGRLLFLQTRAIVHTNAPTAVTNSQEGEHRIPFSYFTYFFLPLSCTFLFYHFGLCDQRTTGLTRTFSSQPSPLLVTCYHDM
jgi:hypothetical protein